ncbi:MAG: heparan-alpha-glucosaminide N-acetyltransferase domain-containing protein [Myxococcota bacterium]
MNERMQGAGNRLVFLDLSRCVALGLMVFAHVSDAMRAPLLWERFDLFHQHFRGITAPIFFVVSGWAFAVATFPHLEAYQRWGPALQHRLTRVGVLFFWGYALTLPWWAEGFPLALAETAMRPFLAFGVLQCVGGALLVAHVLLFLASTVRRYLGWALVLSLATVAVAPWMEGWAQTLPLPLRGVVSPLGTSGGFPIAPHAAYFWLGSVAGGWAYTRGWSVRRIGLWAAVAGLLGLGVGSAFDQPIPASPGLFVYRLGVAALLLALMALASQKVKRLPAGLRIPSAHALSFYVGHMLLIWGVPFVPGLAARIGSALSPMECALWTVACLVTVYGVLWGARRLRTRLAPLWERRLVRA